MQSPHLALYTVECFWDDCREETKRGMTFLEVAENVDSWSRVQVPLRPTLIKIRKEV